MAAKCNIINLVLDKLGTTIWGLSCSPRNNAIAENYIEYLNCSCVSQTLCYEQPCVNNPIIQNCNINVVGISSTLTGLVDINGIPTISFQINSIYGQVNPLTYSWTYDTTLFDLIGNTTSPVLLLKPKLGVSLSGIIGAVGVSIIDANGCTDSLQCYYTANGMQCSNNFVSCANPSNLQIHMIYTSCAIPHKLNVV